MIQKAVRLLAPFCTLQDAHLHKGGRSILIFLQSRANLYNLGCL